MFKKILQKCLNAFGLQVSRLPAGSTGNHHGYHRNEAMIAALNRLACRDKNFTTIIDIGAAAGSWALSAAEIWPDTNYLLFEPLQERQAELEMLKENHSNFNIIQAAAGSQKSFLNFNVSNDLDGSGVASSISPADNLRQVPVERIDDIVNSMNLRGPYLIKLDTHGFEVPIIEGCSGIIEDVSMFIIECYGFQIADQSLLFWQMCEYMDTKGFRLIDIVDIMHRPVDQAFWQCDAFFAKKTLPLFQNNTYA